MKYFVELSDERNGLVKKILDRKRFDTEEFVFGNKTVSNGDALIFSPAKKWDEKLINELPDEVFVFSGNISESFSETLRQKKITHKNYMTDETFVVKNANLTAEGLLSLIIESTKKSIFESSILVFGGGRVAKAIAALLNKLSVKTALCEYNPIKCGGLYFFTNDVIVGEEFVPRLNEFDVIVNSIPAAILSEEICAKIPLTAAVIEAASVSCLKCQNAKFKYILAPSLPQKYCAESAAKLMTEFILKNIPKL